MRTISSGAIATVAACVGLGCQPVQTVPKVTPSSARAYEVTLDSRALNDLPQSCFRGSGLVITSPLTSTPTMRWTLRPGIPDRVELMPSRVWLGDAGSVQLPDRLEGNAGHYAAEIASDETTGHPWARVELAIRPVGEGIRGTMRLLAISSDIQCEVALAVAGRPIPPRLVAFR